MIPIERKDLAQISRGFLMGGADIIPGVSGGTVALILGIYERLVGAISHVDGHLVGLVVRRQWREAAEYFDFRFLLTLGIGILSGVACFAKLMHYLLLEQRMYTLAVFFGLILASSFLVMRMMQPRDAGQRALCYSLAVAAALFAYGLVGLQAVVFQDTLGNYFFAGAIAICAMILPGISGSYILLLMGAYVTVTGIIKDVLELNCTSRDFVSLLVFAAGCACGLIGFSKLLQWLLSRFHMPIMAVLGGFMMGSLRLMWPFQKQITEKRYEQILPENWNQDVTACWVLAVVAMLAVLLLERLGRVESE